MRGMRGWGRRRKMLSSTKVGTRRLLGLLFPGFHGRKTFRSPLGHASRRRCHSVGQDIKPICATTVVVN